MQGTEDRNDKFSDYPVVTWLHDWGIFTSVSSIPNPWVRSQGQATAGTVQHGEYEAGYDTGRYPVW